MPQEDNRWRDKYRQSLAQQESIEKTLNAQQAILHRAVISLSKAAEGHDKEMDERLSAIRSSLKKNDVGGFDRMLKSLDRITIEADKRRQTKWLDVGKGLSTMASQLQTLAPSSDIKPAIKHYKKCIPKGELLPGTLKRLLEEFSHLQTQVGEQQQNDTGGSNKSGLLNRLFKSKENPDSLLSTETTEPLLEPLLEPSSTDTTVSGDIVDESAEWEEVDEENNIRNLPNHQVSDDSQTINSLADDDSVPRHRQRRMPEAEHDRPMHEPAFSRISDRVTIIMTELMDHFPTVPCIEQKAAKARERIARGLNWYELAPTLEDIRDFVIQSSIGSDDNYRLYLKNVYAELTDITHALGLAIESEEQQRHSNHQLHTSIDTGLSTIDQALTTHNDIDQLKNAVKAQVQSIQGALSQNQPEKEAESDSLSTQLTTLIERVKQMEAQDSDIRKQLELEKIRAITDKLTGLPNREAYGEKVHEEMLRWQRYQHPLCLAVLDIDFFKKVNDTYGHQTGDKVLKAVSTSVAQRLREVDFIARFGGEEFIILLPETSAEDAMTMLNHTRERLAKTHMRKKDTTFTVTVSIGIAEFSGNDSAEDVFERADKALYDAKENGRNQCRLGKIEDQ